MNLLLRHAVGPFQITRRGVQHDQGGRPRKLVTLRIDAELDEVIRNQGGDLNVLISDMLYYALPSYVVERRLYKEYVLTGRYTSLFKAWRKRQPAATPEGFDDQLRRLLAGQPSTLTELETPRLAPPIPRPAPNRLAFPDLDSL